MRSATEKLRSNLKGYGLKPGVSGVALHQDRFVAILSNWRMMGNHNKQAPFTYLWFFTIVNDFNQPSYD